MGPRDFSFAISSLLSSLYSYMYKKTSESEHLHGFSPEFGHDG